VRADDLTGLSGAVVAMHLTGQESSDISDGIFLDHLARTLEPRDIQLRFTGDWPAIQVTLSGSFADSATNTATTTAKAPLLHVEGVFLAGGELLAGQPDQSVQPIR
jgi:hypothetical protein